MLDLLTAMDQMRSVLDAVDAPARQLDGVEEWRAEIAAAVGIGSLYRRPAGMVIEAPRWRGGGRFLCGRGTHAAWRDLCELILGALAQQAAHADRITVGWVRRAKAATVPSDQERAVTQAQIAASWSAAAAHATTVGRAVLDLEDAIQVPVGRAIRRAGTREVATDKRYHQRRA